ncbi:hypothetical protein QBC38DRAFT_462612 [Podospora fimiseda]|uniref:Uncharacterized protein n=1 Tax=Podospora fimiseda TaxID=252190 RepID=A0AAN6YMG6_9PEZI|nr:hypothetical protein QBC38DRAFT_462612 [Podospora fimiseda]
MFVNDITFRHTLYENPGFQQALDVQYIRQRRAAGVLGRITLPISYEIDEILPLPLEGEGPPNSHTLELLRGVHNFRPLCWEWWSIFYLIDFVTCVVETAPGVDPNDPRTAKVRPWLRTPGYLRLRKSRAETIWRRPIESTAKLWWLSTRDNFGSLKPYQTYDFQLGTQPGFALRTPGGTGIYCPLLSRPIMVHTAANSVCEACRYFNDIFQASAAATSSDQRKSVTQSGPC